jgi:hypothetical protein
VTPVLGIIASSNQQGRGGVVGSYDALATAIVPSGGLALITFAGIPAGYRHLQIRGMALNSAAVDYFLRYNGDSSSSYRGHVLYGDGGNMYAANTFGGTTTGNDIAFNTGTTYPVSFVTDILDYSSTTKNTTLRGLYGTDTNGAGQIVFISGAWFNTSAVTSISITALTGTFAVNSSFALYGVK